MRELKIQKRMLLSDLLHRYPSSDEVLRQFSINPDEEDNHQTLEKVCKNHDIDLDQLIDTLNDLLDEDFSMFSELDEDE